MNEDPWQAVRQLLIEDPGAHFHSDPFFAITDSAQIDPIIQRVLRQSFRGKMPTTPSQLRAVARRARGSYAALKWKDEGRAWIEKRMVERYHSPKITEEDTLLVADFGFAPGKLEFVGRNSWRVESSEVAIKDEWRGTESSTKLHDLGQQYNHLAISARIVIPYGSHQRSWDVRWIRGQDRIGVYRADLPTRVWVTPPLHGDLSPYQQGVKSLQTWDLELQTLRDRAWGDKPDAPI